jgi:hypothetical protein
MVWENIEDECGASCLTLHFTKSKLKNVFTTHFDLVVNAGKNVPNGKSK